MSQYITMDASWTDNSSGANDEDGTEIDIYTDSPSYAPNVVVPPGTQHGWMRLPPIASGESTATFRLETPVTFVTMRIRQYNADGVGAWDNVLGTTFTIAPVAGADVPPAPSTLGVVVVDGTVITPPPPPVDPPPTTPPPATATTYSWPTQYGTTQGLNQWSYRDETAELTYNTTSQLWAGSGYLGVWSGGYHPESASDVIVRWTAPLDGTVVITGSTAMGDAFTGGGTFELKHNVTTKLGPVSLAYGTPYTISSTFAVVAGDTIDFIGGPGATVSYDSMSLSMAINLTSDGTASLNPILSALTPSSFTIPTGGSTSLSVSLTSSAAVAITVALSSSDVTKVTVPASVQIAAGLLSASFQALGVAAGTSTITATANTISKTSAATVSSPASSTWLNAPLGGTVLLDTGCNDLTGLIDDYPGASQIISDTTAPFSPNNTIRHRIEARALTGGGQLRFNAAQRWRELYFGLYWRTNPQFQGRIVSNKIFFLRGVVPETNGFIGFGDGPLNNGRGIIMFGHNTGGIDNSHIMAADSGLIAYPNINGAAATCQVGIWYKLEFWIKASTTRTARDGEIKWWVNDVLCGAYTQFNYCGPNGESLKEWVMNQTWDGAQDMGVSNTVAWEHYIDHLRIVGKN